MTEEIAPIESKKKTDAEAVAETKRELDKDDNRIAFSMPKKEYEKAAWHYDYLTMLFYDSETGMFLVKPYMREQEKQMQSEYLSLNEWRELKELNKTMRDFNRTTFDLINSKLGGFFGNPIVKILIILFVVIMIIAVIVQYFPQISAAIMPAAQSTQHLVQPLPK